MSAAAPTRPRVSEGLADLPMQPWSKRQPGTHFKPADAEAHERANEGANVDDPCIHCHLDFMAHVNGRCTT